MRRFEQQLAEFFVLCAFLAPAGNAFAATARVFQFVAGDVKVGLAASSERPATKGALISVGDTVTKLGLRARRGFTDGARNGERWFRG